MAALRDAPTAPASPAAGDGPAPVRSWLAVDDPDQAVKDLGDLVEWVDRFYVRFSRAQLSSCWMWHPDVVEELWCLRGAHAEAFHPETGSWLRVGDWLDRQRPGVERPPQPADGEVRAVPARRPPRPPGRRDRAATAATGRALRRRRRLVGQPPTPPGPTRRPEHLAEATQAEYPGAVNRR